MGRFIKDPSSSDPYLRIGLSGRAQYLKKMADDFGVPLNKVQQLADLLGADEDFDALPVHLEELSQRYL